jgi:transposase InsO family protein
VRGEFYAWVTRPKSKRLQIDEVISPHVYQSFLASDRTYGARRVLKDVLELGYRCGLHKIERLIDQGSQYTTDQFQRLLVEQGITCSMSRAGEVWDNSAMESFFSTLKIERVNRRGIYKTRKGAKADVFDYIECFYNTRRRHSTIGYASPAVFESMEYA